LFEALRIIADLAGGERARRPALPFEAGSNEAELYGQTLAFARRKPSRRTDLVENALRLLGPNGAKPIIFSARLRRAVAKISDGQR
jgi:hypothetical protein